MYQYSKNHPRQGSAVPLPVRIPICPTVYIFVKKSKCGTNGIEQKQYFKDLNSRGYGH